MVEVLGIEIAMLLIVAAALAIMGFLWLRNIANPFKKKTGVTLGVVALVAGVILGVPSLLGGGIQTGALTAGVDVDVDAASAGQGMKTIGTLNGIFEREADGDPTAVDGAFEIFGASVDPSSAQATALFTGDITSGALSGSPSGIFCNKDYRVAFNGNESEDYYAHDYGVLSFPCPISDESSVTVTFDGGSVMAVGTIDDILDEVNNTVVNGQTSTYQGDSVEIQCSSTATADCQLNYDESVGDGVFYLDISPSCSSANTVCKDYVLDFVWDLSNPPEGNEYSAITAQLRSGTDFGIPSDILDNWANEVPISLGDIEAGQSATYRLTFTVTEANLDTNDDWEIRADDLGEFNGKDLRLDTGATGDTVDLDSQA